MTETRMDVTEFPPGLLGLLPSRDLLPVPDPSKLSSLQSCASFRGGCPLAMTPTPTLTLITPHLYLREVSLQSSGSKWPNGPRPFYPDVPEPSHTQYAPNQTHHALPPSDFLILLGSSFWAFASWCVQVLKPEAQSDRQRLPHRCVLFRRLHLFLFSAWMTAVASRLQISLTNPLPYSC